MVAARTRAGMAPPKGGRRRGPRKGDLKEAAILDTAWALLAETPVGQITIEDLARGAGLSRSAFYFYFESKDAVMVALASRVAEEIRDAVSVFFEPGRDVTPADLRKAVAAYLGRWKAKGPALRAMNTLGEADGSLRAFWERVTNELLDEVTASFEEQRRIGAAPPGPPAARDLVRALFGMLWRAGYELSLQPVTRAEEQRTIDALTTIVVRACYGSVGEVVPPAGLEPR